MVGDGNEPKNCRIFQQCYLQCCRLQNIAPLNIIIPTENGKVLDFCVDRIKYAEWPPILHALSCDLSLHSLCIKCRQQVKTVLEHIDCERLAKTVNKRCVLLTNFMLSNVMEAVAQLISNTTLLATLILEGLPLRIPYLNPLCETVMMNDSLRHLHLPCCLIGDAGCLAICKCIRCLPNILTLELSACEITPLGAGYIADLVKYQKTHRYSENWIHTLRYRLPDLDTMAGLRRITLCSNPQIGDMGVAKVLEVLEDDLWIKALDIQDCGVTENAAIAALRTMSSNNTLVVLDMRNNVEVSNESLTKIRTALRDNEREMTGAFSWLSRSGSSSDRFIKPVANKNSVAKQRSVPNVKNIPVRNTKTKSIKIDKEYVEVLEEQLQEEMTHRQQLEELNLQLVDQMKYLKQQQIQLWGNYAASSGSEPSLGSSHASGDLSSSSGSTSSIPIDHTTLSYIQQAFKDIYMFIKNNQCNGQCLTETLPETSLRKQENLLAPQEEEEPMEVTVECTEMTYSSELRVNMIPKKAQSSHQKVGDAVNANKKTTKSAHLLGESQLRTNVETKPDMFERQMGDTRNAHNEDLRASEYNIIAAQTKSKKNSAYENSSPCSSVSSDTLVCSPPQTRRSVRERAKNINPREALYSSSESDEGIP